MTIEENRRELFEREYCERHGCSVNSMMKSGKMYLNSRAQTAWYWFVAALDAVVIELPGKFAADPDVGEEYDEFAMGMNTMLRNCNSAIESTGLGLRVLP